MGKAIFWISIFIGVLVITRILARKAAQREANLNNPKSQAGQKPQQPSSINSPEKMVRCDHCGVHLPYSEATITENNVWCSAEHARLGVKQRV